MARMATYMTLHLCHVCHLVSPIYVTTKQQVNPMFAMYVISSPLRREIPMEPERTDYLVGDIDPNTLAAAYRCGHCRSETGMRTDEAGVVHVTVHHDDGCPVLVGALPSTPDVVRALVGHVPDTFRP
jgi:hypothetical protein